MAARAQYGKQRQALPSPDGSIGSKISTKTAQNAQISVETPIVRSNPLVSNKNQAVSVEKQTRETVRRSPIAPFPRLSRHLELLPSSESFAFDWRYFHLHHTQVIFSPTPFIMFKCTFINTYIHFKPQDTIFKEKPFFPFHKKVRIMRGCKRI